MRICDATGMTIVVLIPAVACAAKTRTVYLHRCSVPNAPIVQKTIQSLRAFRRAAQMLVWQPSITPWAHGLANFHQRELSVVGSFSGSVSERLMRHDIFIVCVASYAGRGTFFLVNVVPNHEASYVYCLCGFFSGRRRFFLNRNHNKKLCIMRLLFVPPLKDSSKR